MSTITIGYSPDYLGWTGSHASPMRAHLAIEHIKARAEQDHVEIEIIEPTVEYDKAREELAIVHDADYIERVFKGEEPGHRGIDQGRIATIMFQGTRVLVERIEQDGFKAGVYFNPQGAKHHAAKNHASGFCVFNDMAWAAHHFTHQGLKVAYLDWDVHHGDGVEDLTRDNPGVLTASIHQWGIFPGTGHRSNLKKHVLNYPLERGDGDAELFEAVQDALYAISDFEPDILLMAIGADAHKADPLGQLTVSVEGFEAVAVEVGRLARELDIPVLIGGAGGYTPYTYVPVVWSEVVHAINAEINQGPRGLEILGSWTDETHAWDEDDEETPEQSVKARKQALIDSLSDIHPLEWENVLTSEEFELIEHDITPLIMQALEDKEQAELDRALTKSERRAGRRERRRIAKRR